MNLQKQAEQAERALQKRRVTRRANSPSRRPLSLL
jgi:hypothetical protein